MKKQKVVSCFCSLFLIAIITGCAHPVDQGAPTVFSITPTIQTVVTIPKKTTTPTPLSTMKITPQPTLTLTNVPTLPAEDARLRLLALLATNNDCKLPCLWGITPGKNNHLEAGNILLPLHGIAETAYFESGSPKSISLLYVEGSQSLINHVDFWYSRIDGIIFMVRFRALEENLAKKDEYGNQIKIPVYDSQTFKKRTEYYSLSHVLSEQGMPEIVLVQSYGLPVGGVIDIVLMYPDKGIWANYTMKAINDKGLLKRGCPTNSLIDMYLFPPGDSANFFSLLDKTDWGVTKSGYMPLEKATSLSMKEFYEIFRNPTDKCIETPLKLWPTPETGGG